MSDPYFVATSRVSHLHMSNFIVHVQLCHESFLQFMKFMAVYILCASRATISEASSQICKAWVVQ